MWEQIYCGCCGVAVGELVGEVSGEVVGEASVELLDGVSLEFAAGVPEREFQSWLLVVRADTFVMLADCAYFGALT